VRAGALLLVAACGRIGFEPGDGAMARTIAAGSGFACALHGGTVYCWGRNNFGQLGIDSSPSRPQPQPIFAGVITGPGVIAASDDGGDEASGAASACALDVTRSVACWGLDDRGQLGDGTLETRTVPTPIAVTDAVDVSTSHVHSCAVLASGDVVCWGANDANQIDPGGVDRPSPVTVPNIANVVEVALGGEHTCARHRDGSVSCWGGNTSGQIGNGNTGGNVDPGDLVLPGPYISLAAGEKHTCAVKADGGVECWGDNTFGQLGDGSTTATDVPTLMRNISSAQEVTAGHRNTCVRFDGGMVGCTGENQNGECGDGTIGGRFSTAGRIVAVTDFAEIAVGYHLGCGRRTTGDVVCWGLNTEGELGTGDGNPSATPLTIPLP
jgi:alpha-tubulin suppressor-like RCC1 family protein